MLADERPDHTLQPTALVHEAWMRLAAYRTRHDLSSGDLVLLAGHVMRRVLTDHARSRAAAKRSADRREPWDEAGASAAAGRDGAATVLEVDEALDVLAALDPELARVVELRFFGGRTLEEIAAALGLSIRSVTRRWQLARAWFASELGGSEGKR